MLQKPASGGCQQDKNNSKASERDLRLNKLATKCFPKASQSSSCETLSHVCLSFSLFIISWPWEVCHDEWLNSLVCQCVTDKKKFLSVYQDHHERKIRRDRSVAAASHQCQTTGSSSPSLPWSGRTACLRQSDSRLQLTAFERSRLMSNLSRWMIDDPAKMGNVVYL